jgi:putative hydrolase of the HAD superfamily
MPYAHIFFDLDHTLWDFDKNSEIALTQLYHQHQLHNQNIDLTQFLARYKIINRNYWLDYESGKITKDDLRIGRFTHIFNEFGIKNTDFAHIFGEAYLYISPRQPHLYHNAYDALVYLKQKNYTLHIISNGLQEAQTLKLEASNIHHFFDTMTLPEQAGATKPHRQIYDHALQSAGASAQNSIFIGDDLSADIQGSMNAGWRQIFYNWRNETHTLNPTHEITDWIEIKNIF